MRAIPIGTGNADIRSTQFASILVHRAGVSAAKVPVLSRFAEISCVVFPKALSSANAWACLVDIHPTLSFLQFVLVVLALLLSLPLYLLKLPLARVYVVNCLVHVLCVTADGCPGDQSVLNGRSTNQFIDLSINIMFCTPSYNQYHVIFHHFTNITSYPMIRPISCGPAILHERKKHRAILRQRIESMS